jgi:cyclopropane-fatty-acyl-phospholipid synthase
MNTNVYSDLHNKGVFQYGSDELIKFENHLAKYFGREYALHKNKENQYVNINQGPLALAAEDLADNHYDEGLSFFKNFLDADTMSYTMAYFDEVPDRAITSKKTLEQAQTDKFTLIAKRMKLTGKEKLLNFGCGFGYFESFLLNKYPDIQISSLTHSKDQYKFVIDRTKDSRDALCSERFNIFFGEIDDNCISLLGSSTYDVISSVGLMEQINNIELFFEIISKLLVRNGRMFHHLIVSRDLIPKFLDPEKTLIGKYFPGGKVLPFETLNNNFNHFNIEDAWFINGNNYWMTLEKWHENFWRNIGEIYPAMMDSEKVRYWNNYFVLCKAMFAPENGLAYGNGQYLFYKKN